MNFYRKSLRWHGNSIRNGGRVRGSRARRSVSRLPTLRGSARMRVLRRALPCCHCNSESKVSAEVPAPPPPLPLSVRAPHASRQASDVPTDRCDLWPSGVSLCLIRPSTSCSLANWPSFPRAGPGLLLVPYVLCFF